MTGGAWRRHLETYLSLRHAIGFAMRREGPLLQDFVDHLERRGDDAPVLRISEEVEHAFRGCGTRIPAKWNARRSAATLSGRSLPFGSRRAPEILPVPPVTSRVRRVQRSRLQACSSNARSPTR